MPIEVIVFDFDGVIVESVDIKTEAFRLLFEGEAPHHNAAIVDLHVQNPGVSRFDKFEIIFRDILCRPLDEAIVSKLDQGFSAIVMERVIGCDFVPGAREMLQRRVREMGLFVASSTPEPELKEIVRRRDLEVFFAEVHGAPKSKAEVVRDIMARRGVSRERVLFVGDALSDQHAAEASGVRFVGRLVPGKPNPFDDGVRTVRDLLELDACMEEIGADRR